MKNKKQKTILIPIIVVCILAVTAISVMGVYFAKGKFKDIFVNKQDYFTSDVLSPITSMDGSKQEISSGGQKCDVLICNYNRQGGDYDAFDLTFDVYAWVEEALPVGTEYTITVKSTGNTYSVSGTEHATPVVTGLVLTGGRRSTETISASFPFGAGVDLSSAPKLHIVAVPTAPSRMVTGAFLLGATIKPTHSEAFSVSGSFEKNGNVGEYAAFLYTVSTVGNAPDGGKLVIRWDPMQITLKQVNKQDVAAATGEIELTAQSNHTDTLVFFRNANKAEDGEEPTGSWDASLDEIVTPGVPNESLWAVLEGLVTIELVSNSQE